MPGVELPVNERRTSFSGGIQVGWDATSLDAWQKCEWYYYMTIIMGWRPRKDSVHLWFGKHVATAFERYHKYKAEGLDHERSLKTVVHLTLSDTWDSKADQPIDFPEETKKNRHNLIRSIVWYLEHFKEDTCKTIILSNGKPAVELSFKIEIAPGLWWCGHIDRMVEYVGDPYVTDNKTTQGAVGKPYFKDFDLNNQMSGYAFAGRTLWKIPIKGVLIDALQIQVGSTTPVRGFTHRDDHQLAAWLDNTREAIDDAQRKTAQRRFTRNFTSCSKYGGCAFKGNCVLSPAMRAADLKSNYVKREDLWDPMEAR